MKRPTKYFTSIPYVERQARFAQLGPALIRHPKRYVERSLRQTLVATVGKPADTIKRGEFERVIRAGMKQLNQLRVQVGATWSALALTRDRIRFAR